MIKTQVQIPDELFHRAKRVAAQNEWSFAETVRRGLEYITSVRSVRGAASGSWSPLRGRDCGPFLLPEEEWTVRSHD
jgi:hypothetical protein